MMNGNGDQKRVALADSKYIWADGKFIGGILFSCSTLYLFYVFLGGVLDDFTKKDTFDLVSILVSFFVASTALVFSYQALREQRILRQAGSDPVVLAHLGKRTDTPQLIMFCLTNVGAGAARSVKVSCEDDVPSINDSRTIFSPSQLTHPIQVIRQTEPPPTKVRGFSQLSAYGATEQLPADAGRFPF